MFSHAPIILAFLCLVLLSIYTGSGYGTRYRYNNAKTSTSAEIRDALDGFAARNTVIVITLTDRSRFNMAAYFALPRGQGKKSYCLDTSVL